MVQVKVCFDSWEKIDWDVVNFFVRSLRTLIFKARKREDFENVVRWQSKPTSNDCNRVEKILSKNFKSISQHIKLKIKILKIEFL